MGAAAPPERAELLDGFLVALLAANQGAAQHVVERAQRLGWSLDDVRFELVTPALHDVGERWERGEIGIALEHLATQLCHWLLIGMAGRATRPPASGRRAVVGCSDGELHVLGALMVANVLAEAGWAVLYLGASTPTGAWSPIIRSRRPDVAVVATTMERLLDPVGPTLHSIRGARPECLTVVGGAAYTATPDAAGELNASSVILDARGLPGRLEELIAR